jgi:hypothetical protein
MASGSTTQDKAPSGSDPPSSAQQAEPTPLSALLADLRILDGRLHRAVERVRATITGGTDPGNRGLLIEESDVEGWLSNLGNVHASKSPAGEGGGVVSAQHIGQPGGRLYALSYLFGLGPFERATVLTALAPEVELDYANLYAYVHDDVTKKYPTLDLVVSLWCDTVAERLETRRLLGPEGTLRRQLLLSIDDSPTQHTSLLARPLALDPRIAAFLLGADEPDHALAGSARLSRPAMQDISKGSHAVPDKQVMSLAQVVMTLLSPQSQQTENGAAAQPRPRRGLAVWMRGAESRGKRNTAEQLAAVLGVPLLTIDVAVMTAALGNARSSIYRALREARLQGAIVYWTGADALFERPEGNTGPDLGKELSRVMADWYGCALFDIKTQPPLHIPSGPVSIELDFPAPSNEQRGSLWERALGGKTRLAADVNLPLLVGAFRLAGDQIEAAAESARQAAAWRAVSSGNGEDARITMHDLLVACRTHSNQSLGMLARKITPHYTWSDLVLPPDRLAQLHEMCHHIHHGPLVFETWGFGRKLARGKGLNVLFAGQPGTGKTMGAEVIATDLGLELYKIDLSSVVSKYIGETEKNLEKIFNEGQTSNAILFFDEADSLFGKRSAVKDSHDRYANIETSYLLQRMEEYDGIIILASNLRKNMDDAFIRRLHGAVEFPMPEEPDRLEIWQRTFPAEAPVADDIDLPFLAAQLKLSGGNIKNIVLEAAFLAAEAGTPIGMAHLVRATRREHQKIGKLFHDSDFGQYAHLLRGDDLVE